MQISSRRGFGTACALSAILLGAVSSAAIGEDMPNATVIEPRAFGYQIGDRIARTVRLHAPPGFALDDDSVPQPGGRGNALELLRVDRRGSTGSIGRRGQELTLTYQVMLSPPQARTLELPGFELRFTGRPHERSVRIDSWPVAVSPLVPVEASPRRGLGEMRPDIAPPLIDTHPARARLAAYGLAALFLLGYLAHVYVGLPWRDRARRPFALAWKALRRLDPSAADAQWRQAFQLLHSALNTTAGEVLFEPGIERFVAVQPRFAGLRADLAEFFRLSRREHFGNAVLEPAQRRWLIGFCQRCRDAERGTA